MLLLACSDLATRCGVLDNLAASLIQLLVFPYLFNSLLRGWQLIDDLVDKCFHLLLEFRIISVGVSNWCPGKSVCHDYILP